MQHFSLVSRIRLLSESFWIKYGGDSRYSRQMFKDAASENELEFKTKKVTDKVSETLNVIANEPSLAFFRIQEHVRKCLPQLVETKHEVQELQEKIQGSCFDTEYASNTLKEMQRSSAHFNNMHDLLKNAIFMKQQIDYEKSRREQEKAHPSMYSTKSSPNINYLVERPSRLSRHHSASSDRSSQRSREKRLITDHARPHSSSGVFTNMPVHDHNKQTDRRVQEHISKTVRPKHTSFHTDNSRTIAGTKKHVLDDEPGSGTILKPKKVVIEKESQTGTIVKKHGSCRHHHEKGKSVSSKPNKSKVERGIETDEQVKTLERRESAKSREDYKAKMEDRGKAEKFNKKDQPVIEKSSKGSRKGLFGRHSKGHKKEDQSMNRHESSSDKYTTYGTTG